jgi:hypothetical protein
VFAILGICDLPIVTMFPDPLPRATALPIPFLLLFTTTTAIPYSEYILAPSSRTLHPVSVHAANGSVTNSLGLTTSGNNASTALSGPSAITYDYSKNIGGLVSFAVSAVNGSDNSIGISFSESSFWISPDGSDATQNVGIDETLWFTINGTGTYTVDKDHQRGGFRYLNVYHDGSGSVELSSISTNFTAMPQYVHPFTSTHSWQPN